VFDDHSYARVPAAERAVRAASGRAAFRLADVRAPDWAAIPLPNRAAAVSAPERTNSGVRVPTAGVPAEAGPDSGTRGARDERAARAADPLPSRPVERPSAPAAAAAIGPIPKFEMVI
jgi:hypothetical protein